MKQQTRNIVPPMTTPAMPPLLSGTFFLLFDSTKLNGIYLIVEFLNQLQSIQFNSTQLILLT